jgi:hypothetical protein
MLDMIIGCCVVFCVTGGIALHLGFAAGAEVHKIICRTPPSRASATPPSPQDEWLIRPDAEASASDDWYPIVTHRQVELSIPQLIAVQIAIAVDQAAERVDRPLASNVGTAGTDTEVPGTALEAGMGSSEGRPQQPRRL